jgi:hypothetical protein
LQAAIDDATGACGRFAASNLSAEWAERTRVPAIRCQAGSGVSDPRELCIGALRAPVDTCAHRLEARSFCSMFASLRMFPPDAAKPK